MSIAQGAGRQLNIRPSWLTWVMDPPKLAAIALHSSLPFISDENVYQPKNWCKFNYSAMGRWLSWSGWYILRWVTCLQTITHPSTYCPQLRLTSLNEHSTLLLQASREPKQGLKKHSCRAPNIFVESLWEENFWIFLLKMVHSGVLYISERRRAPKCRGARGSLPHPYPNSRWACLARVMATCIRPISPVHRMAGNTVWTHTAGEET